jgi:aspartyl-tRNA(Asn)/glutamyl-tRNA(Gln) amidotransferase subunit C
MKISDKEIGKLGDLARIKLSSEEKKGLKTDIESILGYVSEIQEVSENLTKVRPLSEQRSNLCNVMREDEEPHESGLYTEKILGNAPQRDGDYIKVKKIL